MGRNGIVAAILLSFLIAAADVSNASMLSTFQRFVAVASADSNHQVSPSPSPDPKTTTPSNETTTAAAATRTTSSKVDSNSSKELNNNNNNNNSSSSSSSSKNNNETAAAPPPVLTAKGETKKSDSQLQVGGQNCTGMLRWCRDDASLVACILNSDPEHKKFMVLVQNEGDSNLKVDISAPNPVESTSFTMAKHQSQKINLRIGDSSQVTLKAGNGECVLHTDVSVSEGNFFFNLPSYDRLITPINGAYFLILMVLIFGVVAICCLFTKKRRQDGIPYQELEMALPESSLANSVETAEVWDQGWDDDWDEENAVKPPPARLSGSISSNGLTSRSPKRDEWENDWDN